MSDEKKTTAIPTVNQTTSSKRGSTIPITKLLDLADHGNWSFKAQVVLKNKQLWDKEKLKPIDDDDHESLILMFE